MECRLKQRIPYTAIPNMLAAQVPVMCKKFALVLAQCVQCLIHCLQVGCFGRSLA